MIVKIVKNYRDSKLDMAVVPCSTDEVKILVEVEDKRAKELIKAGVAEEYTVAKVEKTETKTKTEKKK